MRFPAVYMLLLLAACSNAAERTPPDTAVLIDNAFEHGTGWDGEVQPSLTTAKAHSWHIAMLASPKVPFSYTFVWTLEEANSSNVTQQLKLTGWGLRTATGSTARLVVQLADCPSKETRMCYASRPVADTLPKFGERIAVRLPPSLPSTATHAKRPTMNLWDNAGTSPTYFDDAALLQVEF